MNSRARINLTAGSFFGIKADIRGSICMVFQRGVKRGGKLGTSSPAGKYRVKNTKRRKGWPPSPFARNFAFYARHRYLPPLLDATFSWPDALVAHFAVNNSMKGGVAGFNNNLSAVNAYLGGLRLYFAFLSAGSSSCFLITRSSYLIDAVGEDPRVSGYGTAGFRD